ncbi:hypothetical protein CHUAL_013879 [Chamberlinius hualienensis]
MPGVISRLKREVWIFGAYEDNFEHLRTSLVGKIKRNDDSKSRDKLNKQRYSPTASSFPSTA